MDSPKIGDCGNGLMAGWARPNHLTSATLGLGAQSHPRIQEAPLWAGRERVRSRFLPVGDTGPPPL